MVFKLAKKFQVDGYKGNVSLIPFIKTKVCYVCIALTSEKQITIHKYKTVVFEIDLHYFFVCTRCYMLRVRLPHQHGSFCLHHMHET